MCCGPLCCGIHGQIADGVRAARTVGVTAGRGAEFLGDHIACTTQVPLGDLMNIG
jgi:hypothetical protein